MANDLAHDASGSASEITGIALEQASGPASSDKRKLRIFISYSREDLDFADQLAAALDSSGFACFIDREGISGGEAWKRRLGTLIGEADTVIFVLSPSSARSETCNWEVEEAARLNKRILPANWRPLEGVSPPPRLRDLNYIFFYKEPKVPGSGFGTGLASLVAALNTDFDWVREHTRYLQRAVEWDNGGRQPNRLLSGNDILDSKVWAARRPKSAPAPTVLQLDFIRASEEEADARLGAQRKQLEAMAAAQAERETALHQAEEAQRKRAGMARIRNIALVTMSIFAVVAVLFGRYALEARKAAEQQRTVAIDALLTEQVINAAHDTNTQHAIRTHIEQAQRKALASLGVTDQDVKYRKYILLKEMMAKDKSPAIMTVRARSDYFTLMYEALSAISDLAEKDPRFVRERDELNSRYWTEVCEAPGTHLWPECKDES